MSKKSTLLIISLLAVLLLVSGCSIGLKTSKQAAVNDGGVYKSVDKGETWVAKVLIPSTKGTPGTINTVDVNKIFFDPQDSQALYLATTNGGLIYTYDGGDSWLLPRSQPKSMSTINYIVVDPKASCTIYVAASNRVFKSVNCSRSWQEIYYGTRDSDLTSTVAVDWYDTNIIYAGTTEGNLLQSTDAGKTWEAIERVGVKIRKIMIDPFDSRVVYLAVDGQGIYKTSDKGKNWEQLKEGLAKYSGALDFRGVVLSVVTRNTLFWASGYGLLKSTDGGVSWEPIKLITGTKKAKIYSLAVDPQNDKGIYYATDDTFYKSLDGGENWATKKLPSTRAGTALVIDPKDSKVLYLGVTKITK